MKLKRKLIHPL